MGANFSAIKTWADGETLTAADLNAEFQNFITNLTPAGIDDESTDATAMRATTDPYPASTESLATSLQGELQRIRYILVQITGKTYWYQDPNTSLSSLFAAGTKMWFYQNTAPTGWTLDATPADAVLSVKGGSNAYNAAGGTQAGTWTQPNHIHNMEHVHTGTADAYTGESQQTPTAAGALLDFHGHNHALTIANTATTNTGNGATAITWRPLAQIGIICTKD